MNNTVTAPNPAKDGYATCRVEAFVAIPADSFFDWYMHEPIENFMLGTLMVPPITGTQPMEGATWGAPGAVRLITFKDGTTSLERILSTDLPRSYSYQPWAYTNPLRILTDYATSTMSAVPEGDGTRIIWDYGFHAKYGWAKPFLQLFVNFDWKRNLQGGLKVIKAHLEAHGTKRQIHEVVKAA